MHDRTDTILCIELPGMSTNPRCNSIQQILGLPLTRLYARAGSEAQRAAHFFRESTESRLMLSENNVLRAVDHGVEDEVGLDNHASKYCVLKPSQSLNGNGCGWP